MIYYERWFPHSADADSDDKIVALIEEFGWTAAGWYWDILCKLRKAPNNEIEWSRPFVQTSMAKRYGTTVEQMRTVVQRMFDDLGLLVLVEGKLRSSGMDKNMEHFNGLKLQRAAAGKRSGESRRGEPKGTNGSSTSDERLLNGSSTSDERLLNGSSTVVERESEFVEQEKRREEGRGVDSLSPLPPLAFQADKQGQTDPEQGPEKKSGSGFSPALEALQQIRDKHEGKISNVNEFEKKQITALCWRYTLPKTLEAIEKLGKLRKFGSIDQIERLLKGQPLPGPAGKSENSAPTKGEIPEYKPQARKKQSVPPPSETKSDIRDDDYAVLSSTVRFDFKAPCVTVVEEIEAEVGKGQV